MRNTVLTLAAASLLLSTSALGAHHLANEARIKAATSAAPPAISDNAAVMLQDGTVLREGSNGWTCFLFEEETNEDPVCGDDVWKAYILALAKDEDPVNAGPGVAYMLEGDNPHMMIIVPEADGFAGLNTESGDGKGWLMWGDKAGRHLMLPIGPKKD